ncbi:MAG: hypothetical protein JWR03_2387, partial [Cohnella sp.]|nr:hypothetical protein [Cohnella sp.]
DQSIMYTTADTFIQLWLNQKQAKIEGRVNSIVAAPKKIGGSVVVPYQLVHTLFGANVDLDSKSGQILITAEVKDALPAMPAMPSMPDHTGQTGQTGDGSGTAAGGTSDNPLVEISHSAFQPAKLTIKKGQTVKWVNKDSQIHTVYDLGEAFTSKNLLNKDEFTYTFDKTGTYTYYCSTHPTMQGEITVTE